MMGRYRDLLSISGTKKPSLMMVLLTAIMGGCYAGVDHAISDAASQERRWEISVGRVTLDYQNIPVKVICDEHGERMTVLVSFHRTYDDSDQENQKKRSAVFEGDKRYWLYMALYQMNAVHQAGKSAGQPDDDAVSVRVDESTGVHGGTGHQWRLDTRDLWVSFDPPALRDKDGETLLLETEELPDWVRLSDVGWEVWWQSIDTQCGITALFDSVEDPAHSSAE